METFEDIAKTLTEETPKATTETNQPEKVLQEVANDLIQEEKAETVDEVKTETATTEEKDDLIELVDEVPATEIKGTETFNMDGLKEIGVEVKSQDELKEFISSLKNERDTLKTKAEEIYANEEMRQLNDFVKQGGDLKAYTNDVQKIAQYESVLTTLDKLSPEEAYKQSIVLQYGVNDISQLPEEKQQAIQDYLDIKNPIEIEIEGNKLINSEKVAYQQEVNRLKEGIEKSKDNLAKKNEIYTTNVSKAIQSLTGVDGIKVKDSEKQELATLLKNPKQALAQLMPLDENGLPDAGALVEIVYRHKYGKRNTELLLKKAKSEGKKEVFSKIENSSGKELNQYSKSATEVDAVTQAVNSMLN